MMARPPAGASPAPTPFLDLAVARFGPAGFETVGGEEQAIWRRMARRLGGFNRTLHILQPGELLAPPAPETNGPSAALLAVRVAAVRRNATGAVLYRCDDGSRVFVHADNPFADAFAAARTLASRARPAFAEATLIDAAGGVAGFAAEDAPPRDRLNPFDNDRRPDREAIDKLSRTLEEEIRRLILPEGAQPRTIADGVR